MKWILRGAGMVALFVIAFFLFGYITMYLWNWLMPYLFHLPTITFEMAVGLVILSKILFGSMHMKSNGWGHRKYWKAKWESMSEEDREKFKQDFALRCQHKWGKAEAKPETGNS